MTRKKPKKAEKISVLLAEDDTMIRDVLSNTLQENDMILRSLERGEEFENAMTAELPDVVILDLVMADRDGFEILGVSKKTDAWSATPVIIFTNFSDRETKERAMAAGADVFLVKAETSLAELVRAVKKAARKL